MRRDVLKLVGLTDLGAACPGTELMRPTASTVEILTHITLKVGDLTASVGGNSADDQHRADWLDNFMYSHKKKAALTRQLNIGDGFDEQE